MTKEEQRRHNSTDPKVALPRKVRECRLNQALCFYESSSLAESDVLLNRHLRVAADRWQTLKK